MKKVRLDTNEILLSRINHNTPIFSKKMGKITGMLIREDAGWILRFPNGSGSNGHHPTRRRCIEESSAFGNEFFTEGE